MKETYIKWCEKVSGKDKNELLEIADNEKEIEDRFYKSLEFGTGGLRGILGIGTNRMNVYTVCQATQGVAEYVLSNKEQASGIVIAYDTRHFSEVFALETAKVLSGNGIKVYLFKKAVPTPELSFAVRELNAFGGIVITASHNPAEYNGYKVYDKTGCQITVEAANEIYSYIKEVDAFDGVKTNNGENIIYIGDEIEDRFIEEIYKCRINDITEKFSVVYTPLHGTGKTPVKKILDKIGVNVLLVDEQCTEDGAFPTVKSPNPEEKSALDMGIALAKKENVDLVVGTDPDSDRVGVAIRGENEEFRVLSGNQVGILLLDYILKHKKMQKNAKLIKTIVTTPLADKMAKAHNVETINVLTGFKFIGEKINEIEEEYLFGFEESCGYLVGRYARDKDAVGAVMLICEMAAYYNKQGLTFDKVLNNIYETYGYFTEKLCSYKLAGKDGAEKIASMVEYIRNNCRENIKETKVVEFVDYKNDDTGLPKSNVIYIKLESGASFVIRPSGTEPKIKIYYFAESDKALNDAENTVKEVLEL